MFDRCPAQVPPSPFDPQSELACALAVLLSVTALSVIAIPAGPNVLVTRVADDNIVDVTSAEKFCMIMPR